MAVDPTAALRGEIQRRMRRLVTGDDAPPVATERTDDGLFGPDSASWIVHADPSMFVGGLRALLLQTLHPLAMAGVAEHSDYRHDPLGRLHRTAGFVGTTTYGSTADAEAMITRIRRIHDRVKGTAPDGRAYEANDPHLLEWVHLTEVDSFLRAHQRYGITPLPDDLCDRYVAEMGEVAHRLGVPEPADSVRELKKRMHAYRPEMEANRQTFDTVRFLMVPPLPLTVRPSYGVIAAAAIGLLPSFVRRMLWLPMAPGVEPLVVRPAATALMRTLGWVMEAPPEIAEARDRLRAG